MIDDISIRYLDTFTDKNLTNPVLIGGLPGIGQVGKLVAEYMIHMLGAEKIGEIHSIYLPPQVIIEENGVARLPRNEIYLYKAEDRHIVFLVGDFQSTSNEGHYLMTDAYLDIAAELGVKRIYTLGGFGVGHLVNAPRVLGATNHEELKAEIDAAGVTFDRDEPGGGLSAPRGFSSAWGHAGNRCGLPDGRDKRVYCRPDECDKRPLRSLKTHRGAGRSDPAQRPRSRDGESRSGSFRKREDAAGRRTELHWITARS